LGLALACKGAEAVGRTYSASAVAVRADGGRECAIGAEVENVGCSTEIGTAARRVRAHRSSLDHHDNGKSHASARRATLAPHHPSMAPTPALLQPSQPLALPELAAIAIELEVLKFGREEESGMGMVSGDSGERRGHRRRWMEAEGVGQGDGVGALRRLLEVYG